MINTPLHIPNCGEMKTGLGHERTHFLALSVHCLQNQTQAVSWERQLLESRADGSLVGIGFGELDKESHHTAKHSLEHSSLQSHRLVRKQSFFPPHAQNSIACMF